MGTPLTNTADLEDGFGHTAVLEAISICNPGYRLSINDGALYTNEPTVTLRYLWNAADGITHVKFSNDGGFGSSADTTVWLPVDAEDTLYEGWLLATYGDLLMPRTVYAVFRDAGGRQFGPLQDDIIYDPEAPKVIDVEVLEGTAFAAMSAHGDQVTVRVRPNAHGDEDRILETAFDRSLSPFAIATDLAVGSQARDPDGINLQDRRHIGGDMVRREVCQLMQALIQRTQGRRTDTQVLQLFAHLPQTHSQGAPTPDLSIHVIPEALIGGQQATKVNSNTPPALTPHTGQMDPQFTPASQQLPCPKPIARETMTLSRPAATAFAFSTQSPRHFRPTPVVGAVEYMLDDGD